MRKIIIGDVHGCFEELMLLLQKLSWQPLIDQVYLLGDLVHKGPYSAEVLNFAYKNKLKVILGNHDDFFYQAMLGEKPKYSEMEEILGKVNIPLNELKEWISNWPLWINDEEFFAVHAGLDPKMKCVKENLKNICTNLRYWDHNNDLPDFNTYHNGAPIGCLPWYEDFLNPYENEKVILFGHWAKKEIVISEDQSIFGIDTGCCYGGKLTAFVVNDHSFVQVESLQKKQFNY